MFKVCLDCLFGYGAQNEDVYGRTANGQALGNMTHNNSEMIFRIPKPLNYEDVLEVKGEKQPNLERLQIALLTGTYNIDYNNVVCEIEAHFLDGDIVRCRTILNGEVEEQDIEMQKASDLFQTAQFSVKFILKDMSHINDLTILTIQVDESHLVDMPLRHRFQDIAFLSLSNNGVKVNELNFKFNN